MKSLLTLLKIRGTVLRIQETGDFLHDKRILDAFSESGYLLDGSEHEIVMFGVWNVRANRRPDVRILQQFADYREQGALKMAYAFNVEDADGGWSTIGTETRVLAVDEFTRRGMGRYWRLIVPGSGLLRRQWLEGIKRRAESMPKVPS
jgi:hypothetical protein